MEYNNVKNRISYAAAYALLKKYVKQNLDIYFLKLNSSSTAIFIYSFIYFLL